MKKRLVKSIIAAVLAVILAAVPVLSGFASAQSEICPVIDMRGFMNAKIYAVENDDTSEQLWPPTTDKILDLVKNIIGPLAKLSIDRDWDKFADVFAAEANKVFDGLFLDENGEVTNGSGPLMVYPEPEEVKKDGEYNFVFDWRIDPFEAAAKLNDFINYIIENSGCEQVVLDCHSYAGIVTTCYFEQFGCDAVKSVCYNSTAVYGAGFTTEIIKGNLFVGGDTDFSGMGAEALVAYLLGAFSNNQYNELIDVVIDMLKKAGLVDFITNFVNKLMLETSDKLYESTIVPLFGLWPAIWSMIPDEDFEEGYNYIFNDVLARTDADYSGIKEKIEHYNESVRSKREEILNGINENCNLYVIARYGYSSIPLSSTWETMTDGVLDTEASSFGATCSDYNIFHIFNEEDELVSPNGQVDASTCLFPEQTWFIRSASHTQQYDAIYDFVNTLAFYDGQATVDTFPEYPRFLHFNAPLMVLEPDDGLVINLSFFDRFKLFFTQLFNLITSIFKK